MPTPLPIVVILMGAQGSGKSTLASYLQKEFNAVIYDKDDLELTPDKTGPGSSFTRVGISKLSQYKTLINMIRKNIDSNDFFIIMGNFIGNKADESSESESAMSNLLSSFDGFHKVFLRLDCDPKIQYERVKSRTESDIQVSKDKSILKSKEIFVEAISRRNNEEDAFIRSLKAQDLDIYYFTLDSRDPINEVAQKAYKIIAKIRFPSINMDSSPIRLSPPSSSSASTTLTDEFNLRESDSTPELASNSRPSTPTTEPIPKPLVMTNYSRVTKDLPRNSSSIITFLRAATATGKREPTKESDSNTTVNTTVKNPSTTQTRPRNGLYS